VVGVDVLSPGGHSLSVPPGAARDEAVGIVGGMRSGRLEPAVARRARVAVAALFFTNGALFANLLPRYPEIKTDLGMSNGAFGSAVAAFSAGALVAGLAAAALIRRFSSARVAVAGTWGIAVFTVVAALTESPMVFAGALFVAGISDAMTDVGQNAHGLWVQRVYGRSIINSLHAVWAAGAITGGLMGAGAIVIGMSRGWHLTIAAVLCSALAAAAYPWLLRGRDIEERPAAAVDGSGITRVVVLTLSALVLLAIAGAVVEDAGSSWATLYLRDSLDAPAAVAAFGYVSLVTTMFIGRLLGDRMVDRFGERAVARCGGALVAVGMGAALAFPSVPGTIAGFAAAGLGAATLVPAAMHAADQLPGLRPGSGLTIVTWLMRVGFVGSPLLVGAVADAASLRVGLLSVPVAGLVVVALAGVLSARRRTARS
jgi:MFS family permease